MTMVDTFSGSHRVEWAAPESPAFKVGRCSTAGCRQNGVITRITYIKQPDAPDKKRRHVFCQDHLPQTT